MVNHQLLQQEDLIKCGNKKTMDLVTVHKKDTNQLFLGIRITKNEQTIFRDLGNNLTGKMKRDIIRGKAGEIINYITLQTIQRPYNEF